MASPPSPLPRALRRALGLAVLGGLLLALVPPVLGRGVPDTVVGRTALGAAALQPAIPRGAIGPARTLWTRPARVCAPFSFTMIGLTWRQTGDEHVEASFRFGRRVEHVEADPHEAPDPGSPEGDALQGTPAVWTGERRCAEVRLRLPEHGSLRGTSAVFLNTSGTAQPRSVLSTIAGRVAQAWSGLFGAIPAQADAPQPPIITRDLWGAKESLRACGPFYAEELKVAYVHHTATGNGYSRSRADDVIRGIYAYHVKGRGFCDIAYNFLVDRFGRIHEGRYGGMELPVNGGHAMGFNTGSTGIAVLGNHVSLAPPASVVRALTRLIAWRLDVAHIPPNGHETMVSGGGSNQKFEEGEAVTMRAVVPHRRTGYTTCPGRIAGLIGKIRIAASKIGLPKLFHTRSSARELVQGQTVQLTGATSEPMSWTLRIVDAGGATVRAFSGMGEAIDVTWDGWSDLGVPVPDGDYTATYEATAGDRAARPAGIPIRVCTAPPPAVPGSPTPSPSPGACDGLPG